MSRCENDSRCRGTMVVLLTWGSLYLALSLAIAGPQGKQEKSTEVTNPFDRDKYAIEMGRQHFQAGCAFCHGTRGEGGRGPYLSESSRVRNLEDKKLFRLLRNGIPGTPMPPSSLDATKLWQLVSFLRSLHFSASQEEIPGDPKTGEALFNQIGCSGCHMIKGRGGLVGPDLSDIGASRGLEKLQEAILKPSTSVVPGFRSVSVVTREGRHISGVARNYSNYSVQLVDLKGALHLFLGEQLEKVSYLPGSIMPSATLSESELQDLLAFLSRQALSAPQERDKKP